MSRYHSAGVVEAPIRQRADLRRASRVTAAILLPVGPAAVALLRFVLPYTTAEDATAAVAQVAAHQTAQNAVVWLGLLAGLTLVPGVWFAGRVVGRTAPRLGAAATLLLVPGYLVLTWLVVSDAMLLYGVQHELPAGVLNDLYAGSFHPAATVAAVVFVLGHVVGTILLGIGMLRGRVVPSWAAVATILAQPIHFVAAVVVGSPALDLVGWGLNAVGFAALSIAVLRLADDEWAPAPARV